jgi:glucosamine 6-phosphate synthetase-like amidotransferase/phosphosugar isomerase protein
VFESEQTGFIDSEVIPHYFGELLNEEESVDAAVYELFSALKGSSALALLQIDQESALLHLLYRVGRGGKIGLANTRGEVFCSRLNL